VARFLAGLILVTVTPNAGTEGQFGTMGLGQGSNPEGMVITSVHAWIDELEPDRLTFPELSITRHVQG
jgi:hypothetical protein